MSNNYEVYSWVDVLDALLAQDEGTIIRVPKHNLQHPEDAGARPSVGLPVGQVADYRFVLDDCAGLHIRDFGDFYEAHIDRVDPSCDVVEHVRQDAPGVYVAGAAALGALLGLLFGGSKGSVLVGAGIGALVGGLAAQTRPSTPSQNAGD